MLLRFAHDAGGSHRANAQGREINGGSKAGCLLSLPKGSLGVKMAMYTYIDKVDLMSDPILIKLFGSDRWLPINEIPKRLLVIEFDPIDVSEPSSSTEG